MLASDPYSSENAKKSKKKVPYRGFRVVLGIITLLLAGAFGYLGYTDLINGFDYTDIQSFAMVCFIIAGCMLLTSILLTATQKCVSLFAYLFPLLFSLAATLYAFLFHNGKALILYCAISCAVITAILLIITITSRFTDDDDDDEEDFDDEENESFDDDDFDDIEDDEDEEYDDEEFDNDLELDDEFDDDEEDDDDDDFDDDFFDDDFFDDDED